MGLRDIDPTPPYMRDEYVDVSSRSGTSETEEVGSSVLDELRERPLFSSLWIIYGGTAIATFCMIFVDSIVHSTGFFSFIWQAIKGAFIGILGGILWPFLLLFDISDMWVILLPFVGTLLLAYKLFFEKIEYERQFYIGVIVYVLIVFIMIVYYFSKI